MFKNKLEENFQRRTKRNGKVLSLGFDESWNCHLFIAIAKNTNFRASERTERIKESESCWWQDINYKHKTNKTIRSPSASSTWHLDSDIFIHHIRIFSVFSSCCTVTSHFCWRDEDALSDEKHFQSIRPVSWNHDRSAFPCVPFNLKKNIKSKSFQHQKSQDQRQTIESFVF